MSFTIVKAKRKAVPMLLSVSGTSGSGKTYTALLLAAGMAGPSGRVGLIDTENGRGSMYADSPGIIKALPNGYEIIQFDPPFTPARYVEALREMEKAGVNVCVIDSATHEWEGEGGCTDIAEQNKLRGMPNWAKAKLEHKRFVNYCLSSGMHIIFCLRAREKTKIVKDDRGKEQFVPQGIQPISEKNFVFEMLVSVLLDEATHHAIPLKVPEPLQGVVAGGRMLTKEDGERIRQWNQSGAALGEHEQLEKRSATTAERGTAEYEAFFKALTPKEKKHLVDSGLHARNKESAAAADAEQSSSPSDIPVLNELPDPMEFGAGDIVGLQVNGVVEYYTPKLDRTAWERTTIAA